MVIKEFPFGEIKGIYIVKIIEKLCIAQLTVNHIEIRSYEEAIQFQEKFSKGLFKNEAQESIQYLKNSFKEELCYA